MIKKFILFLILLVVVISGGLYIGANKYKSKTPEKSQSVKIKQVKKQDTKHIDTQASQTDNQSNIKATNDNANTIQNSQSQDTEGQEHQFPKVSKRGLEGPGPQIYSEVDSVTGLTDQQACDAVNSGTNQDPMVQAQANSAAQQINDYTHNN